MRVTGSKPLRGGSLFLCVLMKGDHMVTSLPI